MNLIFFRYIKDVDAKNENRSLYRNIFTFACNYSQGASFLEKFIMTNGALAFSFILSSTFCIELLLKCLLLIKYDDVFTIEEAKKKNISLNGHCYSQLFGKLDQDIQDKIIQSYKSLYNESISKQEYIQLLRKFGDAGFLQWRYGYESMEIKTFDLQLLNRISEPLANCIQ